MNRTLLLACVACGVLAPGCMRAARQGLSEVMGADGKLWIVTSLPADTNAHAGVRFERVITTLPERYVPPAFLSELDAAYARLPGATAGGAANLRVASEVQYYRKKSLTDEAVVHTRVRVHRGGSQVGDALIIVTSNSFRASDPEDLAKETAKAVSRLLGLDDEPRPVEDDEA